MIKYRTLKTQAELNEAIQLSNQVFFQCDSFFERRYPHVFSLDNLDHLFGAFNEGELVSFIATYPSIVSFKDSQVSVCTLGSVCTHPDFQGQRISFRLLEYVGDALNDKVDLLFISGEGKNYLRFNASVAGKIYEVHVPSTAFMKTSKPYRIIRRYEDLDVNAYHRAYLNERKPKFERSLKEQKLMVKGHFEALGNEQNLVLQKDDEDAFACVRIAYEGENKIAFMIERVGDFDLQIAEDLAKHLNCDKFFYRSQDEICSRHQIYTQSIPITGTIKVIRPKFGLHAVDWFGDLNQTGQLPSLRVDHLNFL